MTRRNLTIRSQYDFRSDVLDVILSGRSLIDAPSGLHIRTLDDAYRFIRSYGYDFENPIEKAEVMGNFHEAMNFIRRYFLYPENPDGLRLEIPRKIIEISDIAELFRLAGQELGPLPADAGAAAMLQTPESQAQIVRGFACAILKVMHTVAHIDKDLRSPHFLDIQMQILDRYYKVIHRDSEGRLYLGGEQSSERINLIAFETKPKKSRDSIVLKLLHKPENVAQDIFDRVGIRFITETTLDALRVVKFLKDEMIVVVPNLKPSRSRNTLVDLPEFKSRLLDLRGMLDRREIGESEFVESLREAAHAPRVNPENPHSSEFYRAIQFTCRQLIKLRNPIYGDLREIRSLAKKNPAAGDILKVIDRIDLTQVQKEVRFFYPYEVQVLDQASHQENERGRSAHSEYKKAQLQTALRRVMGGLADVAR